MLLSKNLYMKTEWTDPETGTKGYLVIDELFGDLCGGGIRMRSGLPIDEVEELAKVMTSKFMAMSIPCGGAKGGIDYDPDKEDSREVLKRYLLAHRPFIKENWGTSEDLGTREEDILAILGELGVRTSVHCILNTMEEEEGNALLGNLVQGLFMQHDGLVFTDVTTGYGVSVAAREGLKRLGIEPEGAKASIQGFGTVGGSSALYLSRQGIRIVAITDAEGTMYSDAGFDIPELLKIRSEKGVIDRERVPEGTSLFPGADWLSLEVDLLVPAAISNAITTENADRISTGLMVEGANMPTSASAEESLVARGVRIIPDFIANSGGIGLFGALLFHRLPPEPETILGYLDKTITESVNRIFDISEVEGIALRVAAGRLVDERKEKILRELQDQSG